MGGRHLSHTHFADIRRVVDRLLKLAHVVHARNPDLRELTLWPRDFDLICKHPKTAELFQIIVPEVGPPRWRQFVLKTAARTNEPSAAPNGAHA